MPSSQQNDHSEQDLEMVVTQPENREQTFDEKIINPQKEVRDENV